MAKFKVEATRTDQYEIEIDDQVWTEQVLKECSDVFHQLDDAQDVAKCVCHALLRFGSGNSYEGFGYIKTLNKDGVVITQFGPGFKVIAEAEYCAGIVVKVLSEDDEYDFDCREIIDNK